MKIRIARRALLLLTAALLLLCAGCQSEEDKPKYETLTLNTVDKFFCNGVLLEANVRELNYDGNDASVRIRFTNLGDDPIDGIDANVRFLDADGNLLFEEGLHLAFEEALYRDETVSASVSCSGRDVRRIAGVSVTG